MGFDFANGFSEFMEVDVEAEGNVRISGSSRAISGELNSFVGGTFKVKDIGIAFLTEALTDGIDNVQVAELTADSVTLEFRNGAQVDTLKINNASALLASVDASLGFDFGNGHEEFAIFDASTDTRVSGSTRAVSAELNDIVGGTMTSDEVVSILTEEFTGDGVDNVDVLNITSDSVTLAFGGSPTDVAVFVNVDLSQVDTDGFNFQGSSDDFIFVDGNDGDPDQRISGSTNGNISAEARAITGGTFTEQEIDDFVDAINGGNEIDGVTIVDQDSSSVTLAFEIANGAVDTVFFDLG